MRNCLILGSGRSGTSMVAGILAKSGYNAGDDYLSPRETNPTGFYEDETVNRLNDRILQTAIKTPRAWSFARSIPVARILLKPLLARLGLSAPVWWLASPTAPMRLPSDDEPLLQKLLSAKPFAYKDPRLSHTLPIWRPYLPAGTVRIVVFREPSRTANSIAREMKAPLYRHSGIDYDKAMASWIATYRSILGQRNDSEKWIFMHFDEVLSGGGIPRLEQTLGTSLDLSHIDASLKRSPSAGFVPPEAQSLYLELMSLCESAAARQPGETQGATLL